MKHICLRGRAKSCALSTLSGVLTMCWADPMLAQHLGEVPGFTEVQQPVANAIQSIWFNFNAPGYTGPRPNPNGTLTERLLSTCAQMVQTANDITGLPGNVASSLRIDQSELASGLQAIAPVQMNAQKQLDVVHARANMISGRLFDLRAGHRGFSVSSNVWGPEPVAVAQADAERSDVPGLGGVGLDTGLEGPLGGFLNVSYNWGSVDQTVRQDAYDYDNVNAVVGLDYRFTDSIVVGGAVSYNHTSSSYEQSLGDVDESTFGLALYGTYYRGGWYVDGFLAYGYANYDTTRNINIPSNNPAVPPISTSATADPEGEQWSASAGVGYSLPVKTWNLTPFARLGYIWVRNKAFQEDEPVNGLGLAVDERTIESLQSALGLKVSRTFNTASGVWGPYLSVQWIHEFENETDSIVTKYAHDPFNTFFVIPTEDSDTDYAVFTIGTTVTLPRGLSGFVQLSTAEWLHNVKAYGAVLGLRKQF